MVCTANDLLEWKDFPKGLRVLLLDKDAKHASEIRLKLEGMDYIVSTFCNEDEALSALLNKSEVFHVAIVEVSSLDWGRNLKFLQMAKGLPTIMTASEQCLTTAMKCIALGAIEVLNKPISEEKLRNIWQHVVHKAYNYVENAVAGSPRPVSGSMIPVLNRQEHQSEHLAEMPYIPDEHCDDDQDRSSGNDKCPAPSTPQLKQVRSLDDAGCPDQTNWSTEKDSAGHCEESKSVDTTCCNAAPDMLVEAGQLVHENVKEENDSPDGFKSESDTSPHQKNGPEASTLGGNARIQAKAYESRAPCGPKSNRKKMKLDWTSDLHKKFVQAVEQLGVDQAIPSRILELMKMEGLTRHNVASHLQKYRMQRRHALPKREVKRIPLHPKDTMQSSYYYHQKPIMAYMPPPYHSNQTLLANHAYPMPSSHDVASPQAWGPSVPPYQTWPWKSHTAMQADVWGCPVMPPLQNSYSYPRNMSGYYGVNDHTMPPLKHDNHLADEIVDKIVKEAISKPWLPLPLGLKAPSTESVLFELSKQGISNIPPPSKHHFVL